MKKMRKIFATLIAMVMVLSMGMSVFAADQSVPATTPDTTDNASITINNPAKGETYSVFKLFDAKIGENGEISYQCEGEIPSQVSAFFTKDASNNVIPDDSILEKDTDGKVIGSVMTDDLKAALEAWANAQSAPAATAESDGSDTLTFTGLSFGYYVMTTTHEDDEEGKALITVTSINPHPEIYDKNNTVPEAKEKKVYDADGNEITTVSIGDTVTYVAKFDTTNYVANGTGTNGDGAKQVEKYVISDTLPEYMTEVTITSVTVGGTALTPVPAFSNKQFEIKWTDDDGNSLYAQGAEIVVTYTAKITSTININTTNKNTISIQPYVDGEPYEEPYSTSNEVKTYAAAIKKVDQDGEPLKGAQFTIKGLVVEGSGGIYTVVSYDPSSTTESAVLDTDEDGKLYIVGLASDVSLTVTEYKEPDGYNKLTAPVTLTPQVLSTAIYKEAGTYYYDADGNLTNTETSSSVEVAESNLSDLDADALPIENKKGVELPSTGGIGTTMFYVVGSILVIGAAVVLISKRRMTR